MHEPPVASFAMLDFGREIAGWLPAAERASGSARTASAGSPRAPWRALPRRYHGLLVAALAPPSAARSWWPSSRRSSRLGGAQAPSGQPLGRRQPWIPGATGSRAVPPGGHRPRCGRTPRVPCAREARLDGARREHDLRAVPAAGGPEPCPRGEGARQLPRLPRQTTARGGSCWSSGSPGGLARQAFQGARPLRHRGGRRRPRRACLVFPVRPRRASASAGSTRSTTTCRGQLPGGARGRRDATFALSSEETPATDGDARAGRASPSARRGLVVGVAGRAARRRPSAGLGGAARARRRPVRGRPARCPTAPTGSVDHRRLPWFADWGRDTMIALPGLAAGHRPGRRGRGASCATFARFVRPGHAAQPLPRRRRRARVQHGRRHALVLRGRSAPTMAATGDDATLAALFPVLADIVRLAPPRHALRHRRRPGRRAARARASRACSSRGWTPRSATGWSRPRTGKPVEINALWYNALRAMAGFARAPRPARGPRGRRWPSARRGVRALLERGRRGYCHDVIDGPDGDDRSCARTRSWRCRCPHTPAAPERPRARGRRRRAREQPADAVRAAQPRAAADPRYQGRYGGGPRERDGAYHQGTVWAWLLGPFALAHYRVHGDAATAARGCCAPIGPPPASDRGLGSIAEIFDGDRRRTSPKRRVPAQAWSVGRGASARLAPVRVRGRATGVVRARRCAPEEPTDDDPATEEADRLAARPTRAHRALEALGAVPVRAPVGHGARGLLARDGDRLGRTSRTTTRAAARLPLGRGRARSGSRDRECRLCFALALWNGRDPILKERLFGLTGPEGNHGEDVKECYFYLDSTPTHSYMKALYKYPQARVPVRARSSRRTARRGRAEPGVRARSTPASSTTTATSTSSVEYAKAAPDDILIRITRRPTAGPSRRALARAADALVPQHLGWGRGREAAAAPRRGARAEARRRVGRGRARDARAALARIAERRRPSCSSPRTRPTPSGSSACRTRRRT